MFKFEKLAFGDLGWGDELLFATLMTITVSIYQWVWDYV
jgi:hypothetical protein